jgi:NAD(P)-dependent dehydrogenase (short-subunit alcohol dehydrogenase family)
VSISGDAKWQGVPMTSFPGSSPDTAVVNGGVRGFGHEIAGRLVARGHQPTVGLRGPATLTAIGERRRRAQ